MAFPIQQWWHDRHTREEDAPGHSLAERLAEREPRLYRLGLELVAGMGHAFLYGLPLLALGAVLLVASRLLTGDAAWTSPTVVALAPTALVLGWACVEVWRLRPALPKGVAVRPETAPQLHAMVKRRIQRFHAPAIDRILLTRDARIRVVSTPVNGFLFRHAHSLCLGVPLLHMLNPAQLRLALHCAIGQHAGLRDPGPSRLARLREDWAQCAALLQQRRSPGAWLLRAFSAWYTPILQRWSAAAAREHDLQHDQYAVALVKDIEVLAMIAAEEVCKAYLEHGFWPLLMKSADRQPNPTVRPFSNFEPILRSTLRQADAEHWLLKAITAPEAIDAPRPSLAQRVDALGYGQLHFFALPDVSAMTAVLGRSMRELLQELDQQWRTEVNPAWRARHQAFRDEKNRFERLHERFQANLLEGPAAFAYARLVSKHLPEEVCIRIYQTLLERDQDNPEVLFEMGKLLLDMGEVEGVRAIEQAIALDKSYVGRASAVLAEFSARRKLGLAPRTPGIESERLPQRIHAA